MLRSMIYMDYNERLMLEEAIGVMNISYGGFNFSDIRNMDFDSLNALYKICVQIDKEDKKRTKMEEDVG